MYTKSITNYFSESSYNPCNNHLMQVFGELSDVLLLIILKKFDPALTKINQLINKLEACVGESTFDREVLERALYSANFYAMILYIVKKDEENGLYHYYSLDYSEVERAFISCGLKKEDIESDFIEMDFFKMYFLAAQFQNMVGSDDPFGPFGINALQIAERNLHLAAQKGHEGAQRILERWNSFVYDVEW